MQRRLLGGGLGSAGRPDLRRLETCVVTNFRRTLKTKGCDHIPRPCGSPRMSIGSTAPWTMAGEGVQPGEKIPEFPVPDECPSLRCTTES